MNVDNTPLEDLLEAHLAGERVAVPDGLRREFDQVLAGHEALQYALGETIAGDQTGAADRLPPVLPGDYEIVRELGRGGMGVVYLVQQKSLGRLVAVKVLRPGEATFGRHVKRFLEEARHLARLRHANIVSIHEIGQAGDEPYFTMDYVEGEPLSALLARERLSPTRALAIWKQAAEGVQHAHSQGIIHRDLKPGNVLVDARGRAYVTDFGLARDMTQTSRLTHTGEVMGTPAYMAPEQALGQAERIGEATDVHALGAILYEMLTGKTPYGSDAPANVLVRLLKDEPVALRRIDRRISRELETVCLKAIAKEPEWRYATVRAFLEDVRRFESGEAVQARRPGIVYRTTRAARRHWKIGLAVALTAAAVLASASFLFRPGADNLIVAGDERHTAGDHGKAVQVYQQALSRSGTFQQVSILERLIRCSQESGDVKSGVEAGLQLLKQDPDAWLGEFDSRVTQALVARVRESDAHWYDRLTAGHVTVELAERRLEHFLSGPLGTDEERKQAEQDLAAIRASLGKEPFESITDIFPGMKHNEIPKGTPEELLRRAEDSSIHIEERKTAAYAAAMTLEKSRETAGALAAYRRAYELLRLTHPVYTGMSHGINMASPRTLRDDSPEARVLRHLSRKIRSLDPQAADPLRGGLRFRITGLDLPPDLAMQLAVLLIDPAVPDPNHGTQNTDHNVISFAPLGRVNVQLDQTAWVGVADGTYRLYVNGGPSGGLSSDTRGAWAGQVSRLMTLDFTAFPKEVEIRGQTIDLEIRAALLDEINLTEPAQLAEVDLNAAVFRWSPIANEVAKGAYYVLELWITEPIPGGERGNHLGSFRCDVPSLRIGDRSPDEVKKLESLTAGRNADWTVKAYDAAGRRTSVSRTRRFQVRRGISQPDAERR